RDRHNGLTSKAGHSFTGVVTALLSAATPLEMAEESRFLVRTVGDFLRCGGQARTVSPVDVTAVRGSQLTYCVEVAAELLADVEEQTVRSVHQAQRPGRESPYCCA